MAFTLKVVWKINMLSPELLKKIDSIFIRSRHKVTDIFAGEFESAFRGRGMEFEEFREYVPGDDVRTIDWNVTARMDKPFVKTFREEREQTIFFLVDFSRSEELGAPKTKREVLTEITALLAYATIKTNDKVGLIIFSDHVEKYIAPKKGRAHVWNLIAALMSHEPKGTKTNFTDAVQFLLKVNPRRTTCFFLSDFWDANFENPMRVANYKHDLIAIRLLSPIEKSMPKGALIDFEDLEGDGFIKKDFSRNKSLKNYQMIQKKYDEKFLRFFSTYNIDYLNLTSDGDYVDSLLKFFIKREKHGK